MGKKLYVGNLPFSTTEEELRELFGRHGSVDSVSVITDRETGRPRGFAFVEMSEPSAAADAIRALDGTQLGGRALKVNEAQDKRSGGGAVEAAAAAVATAVGVAAEEAAAGATSARSVHSLPVISIAGGIVFQPRRSAPRISARWSTGIITSVNTVEKSSPPTTAMPIA